MSDASEARHSYSHVPDLGSRDNSAGAEEHARRTRKRRRVLFVNEVDERLISRGIPTSLEDRVSDQERQDALDKAHIVGEADQSNTARLAANVPPHSQARI